MHDIWPLLLEQSLHRLLCGKAVYPRKKGPAFAKSHMSYLGTASIEARNMMAHLGNQFSLALHTRLLPAELTIFVVYNKYSHSGDHSLGGAESAVPNANQQSVQQ